MSFTLAACAEMLFRDLPVAERVRRIDELGFEVEIWDWTTKDLGELKATGATFSSMTGYITGSLTDEAGADELLSPAASPNCRSDVASGSPGATKRRRPSRRTGITVERASLSVESMPAASMR